MPGGLTLLQSLPVDIPTPASGKVTIFFNTSTLLPSYKDDAGVVHTLTGSAGIAGSAGPIGPVMFADAGLDGEMGIGAPGIQGPPGTNGSGSAAWSLVGSSTPTGVNLVDFTGLAGLTDVRVVIRGITYGTSDQTAVRVSTNNGSSYLAASGDYSRIAGNGDETVDNALAFHSGNGTTAKTGEVYIEGFNLTGFKISRATIFSVDGINLRIIPVASALNAVRVCSLAGFNFTGGTIQVFGR